MTLRINYLDVENFINYKQHNPIIAAENHFDASMMWYPSETQWATRGG